MKKVQVLLSSYNGQKYIRQQLESILNQKGVSVHCLVRDDGSTDNTINILTEYQEKYLNVEVIYGENQGYKMSFMQLVQLSGEFDFYAFADQDDVWEENKLIRAIEQMSNLDESIPVMYCSNCRVVDENLEYIHMLHHNKNILPESKIKALYQGFAHGCTMVFNLAGKNLVDKYKVKQEYAHDFWIPLLFVLLGKVIYDNQAYILYRQHTGNVLGSQRSLMKIINIRLKQLRFNKNYYSNMVNEILEGYSDLLSSSDYVILTNISSYRTSLSKKVKLLFNSQLKRDTLKGTLFLKYLIISSRF